MLCAGRGHGNETGCDQPRGMTGRSCVTPPTIQSDDIAFLREDRGVGHLREHRTEYRESLGQIAEDLCERSIMTRCRGQRGEGMVCMTADALVVLRSHERTLEAFGEETAKRERRIADMAERALANGLRRLEGLQIPDAQGAGHERLGGTKETLEQRDQVEFTQLGGGDSLSTERGLYERAKDGSRGVVAEHGLLLYRVRRWHRERFRQQGACQGRGATPDRLTWGRRRGRSFPSAGYFTAPGSGEAWHVTTRGPCVSVL